MSTVTNWLIKSVIELTKHIFFLNTEGNVYHTEIMWRSNQNEIFV